MNLGIWYVCNMHESFLSKIHPFSVVAKPDMKIVMKRDSGRLALLGDSASVFTSCHCGRAHSWLVRLLDLVGL